VKNNILKAFKIKNNKFKNMSNVKTILILPVHIYKYIEK